MSSDPTSTNGHVSLLRRVRQRLSLAPLYDYLATQFQIDRQAQHYLEGRLRDVQQAIGRIQELRGVQMSSDTKKQALATAAAGAALNFAVDELAESVLPGLRRVPARIGVIGRQVWVQLRW